MRLETSAISDTNETPGVPLEGDASAKCRIVPLPNCSVSSPVQAELAKASPRKAVALSFSGIAFFWIFTFRNRTPPTSGLDATPMITASTLTSALVFGQKGGFFLQGSLLKKTFLGRARL